MTEPTTQETVIELAADHGLQLEPGSVRLNEAGLDFRVAIARTLSGDEWVLRMPRRADVSAKVADEAAILATVRPHLSVAVPDWRIRTPALIAYPLLPGQPGLTLNAQTGEPDWRFDPQSLEYAAGFGELLAELHAIPVAEAEANGMQVQTPDAGRQEWREQLDTVATGFTVDAELHRRWSAWIDDDSSWPTWSVVTHGELYPAHVLIDEQERPTAVLDWTTAKVGDPGRDFALHLMVAGAEAFAVTVDAYERAGGRTWPRLADHCAQLAAAGPIGYGIFALLTGQPEHRAAAQAQLDPSA